MTNEEAKKQIEALVRLYRVASSDILEQSQRATRMLDRQQPAKELAKSSIKTLEARMLKQSERLVRLAAEIYTIRESL